MSDGIQEDGMREGAPTMMEGGAEIKHRHEAARGASCHCGASRRKPLCDGSHVRLGTPATVEPAASSVVLDIRNGPGAEARREDDAQAFEGRIEVYSGTGTTPRVR